MSATDLARLGIAQVVAEALLEAMIMGRAEVAPIREACERSVYWPEFCDLVQRGDVAPTDIADNQAVAECVLLWARSKP